MPRKEFSPPPTRKKKKKLTEEEREEAYREAAQCHPAVHEGDIEIDEAADVSESDGGAYVQAWVWVSDEDAGLT